MFKLVCFGRAPRESNFPRNAGDARDTVLVHLRSTCTSTATITKVLTEKKSERTYRVGEKNESSKLFLTFYRDKILI